MLQPGNQEADPQENAAYTGTRSPDPDYVQPFGVSLAAAAAITDVTGLPVTAFTYEPLSKLAVGLNSLCQQRRNQLFTSLAFPRGDCNPVLQPVKRNTQSPPWQSSREK